MRVFLTPLLMGLFYFSAFSQTYNQNVSSEVCEILYDTSSCFPISKGTVDIKVGEYVTKLNEAFRFCLSDSIFSGTLPIKVVFALDVSGSMDKNDPTNMRCEAAHTFIDDLKSKSPGSYETVTNILAVTTSIVCKIEWPKVSFTASPDMPSAGEYFRLLSIKTYDDMDVPLQPETIVRIDDKSFNVPITENSGLLFETGWKYYSA